MSEPTPPLLQVQRLHKRFAVGTRKQASWLHAVDDISLHIAPGESLGLVGESGCGKSTLVRVLARLLDATEGAIVFDGEDLARLPAKGFARTPQRPHIQMVFQDPTDSLNPRYTAGQTIAEPLRLLIGVGLLGGFTTFSAFSSELITMLHRGQTMLALGYAAASLVAGMAAVIIGLVAAQSAS